MSSNPKPLEGAEPRARIPGATYRLQFNSHFTLDQGITVAEYLGDLGITDCYGSPIFTASPGSTHGYDICQFNQVNPALGGAAQFLRWANSLQARQLGLLLDFVPNHMGNDLSNPWWFDVLEFGRRSPFASFFDINWHPVRSDLKDKVLVPILEDEYAKVLESGKLRLVFQDGAFGVQYYDRRFPVAAESYGTVLNELASVMPEKVEVAGIRSLSEEWQAVSRTDELSEKAPALKEKLRHLHERSEPVRQAIARICQAYQGEAGQSVSFDRMDTLLHQQHYRLAFWQVGPEEINYRRFFDVTTLAAVRMEDPAVFAACHQLIFDWLSEGKVSGLRIDHPDGLWDPQQYFCRIQAWARVSTEAPQAPATPDRGGASRTGTSKSFKPSGQQGPAPAASTAPAEWREDASATKPALPFYLVVEKILSRGEPLRADWPVHGTTGYDFLNQVNGLFVNSANEAEFDRIYREFTGRNVSFADEVYAGKRQILEQSLISEWKALTHQLWHVAMATRYGQDLTFEQLRQALLEVIAAFPVYRTYVDHDSTALIARERDYVEQATAEARRRAPHLQQGALNFVAGLLLLESPPDLKHEDRERVRRFVMSFQQLTGPVTAKGLEDTAFYRYNRLISLNEVGGDPEQFGLSSARFHQENLARAALWPHTLLATATHDTKRGEDARARINVLSEIPAEWLAALNRWTRLNADKRTVVQDQAAPRPNDEYLLYQALIGAWPLAGAALDLPESSSALPIGSPQPEMDPADLRAFRDRMVAYMMKALKEAKDQTSWTQPNAPYERAVQGFLERILDPTVSTSFLEDFRHFHARVAFFAKFNSIAQVLLKMTSPGVPDFYQGTELWDFSLVDPDNRRPVEYGLRRQLLLEARQMATGGNVAALNRMLQASHTGQVKLWLIALILAFRREHPALFSGGSYLPIAVSGPMREHVCAFARASDREMTITVVPRLVLGLTRGNKINPVGSSIWHDTALELNLPKVDRPLVNLLTGQVVEAKTEEGKQQLIVAEVLATFPAAVLHLVTGT